MARNCRFPDLGIYGSQPKNQRVPLQGIAGSQKLEFMFSKLSGYHCKELRVPQSLKLMVPSLTKVTLPVEGSVDCKKVELMVLNVFDFFLEPVTEPFVLLNGPVAECLRLAGPAYFFFARRRCMSKSYENSFFTILWFCLMVSAYLKVTGFMCFCRILDTLHFFIPGNPRQSAQCNIL